jgi:hypothetical protein
VSATAEYHPHVVMRGGSAQSCNLPGSFSLRDPES